MTDLVRIRLASRLCDRVLANRRAHAAFTAILVHSEDPYVLEAARFGQDALDGIEVGELPVPPAVLAARDAAIGRAS